VEPLLKFTLEISLKIKKEIMKSLWQWEKHDVVNYLRANFLETEVEFTTESLIKQIKKSKHDHYWFGYDDKVTYDKNKILLEHLVGLTVEENKFVPIKKEAYNKVSFYDDVKSNILNINNSKNKY
jgi:hypothetical protein